MTKCNILGAILSRLIDPFNSFIHKYILMNSGDQFPFNATYDWGNKVFLGEGGFGKVFKAKNLKDNQFYAIKQMKMEDFNRDKMLMDSLKGEIAITMELNSQYTVKMIDAKIGKKFTYIVLQICDNDLRKELASRKFTQEDCVHAYEQIMQGFRILVNKGYIHRDIKPANVLLKNKRYKVSDFGFACKADILGKKKLTDICGTPIYMAPQLLKNQPYTAKSDIWSLGLMLYEMVFGYAPWPCRSLEEYIKGIYNKPLSFPYNAKIGQNTKDFIKRSLVVDQSKRMSWQQVFKHPLIKQKDVGQVVQQLKIQTNIREILLRLQSSFSKQGGKWSYYIDTYSNQNINFALFQKFLKQIDSNITPDEAKLLFQYFDKQNKKSLHWRTLEQFFIHIDYRDCQDILSRKIDEIVAILKERKTNPLQVFEQIDINHSGFLDINEFNKFILAIAPKYTNAEILQLYRLFDNDKNGSISKQEFINLISSKMPIQKQKKIAVTQRGKSNMKLFKSFLSWSGFTPEKVFNMGVRNKNTVITSQEFMELVLNKLNFKISKEEVLELIGMINTKNDSKISLQDLKAALS